MRYSAIIIGIKGKQLNNDEIDFLLVFEGMKKNISYYQNNLQPVYLSDPVAEKKDPLWFAKKKI